MQEGPRVRRRVLVATTRGGVGAPPRGEPVAYAALGGVVESPEGEPALPPPGPDSEPAEVAPVAAREAAP